MEYSESQNPTMDLPDLYRAWAGEYLHVASDDIEAVEFHSTTGGGSRDIKSDDFSTFAGDEIWSASVEFKNGSRERIRVFDANPVNLLMGFAEKHNIIIGHKASKPLTKDEKTRNAISDDIQAW